MLVGGRRLGHRIHVHPTLVRKRRATHKGSPDVGVAIGQFVHEEGNLPELGQIGNHLKPHLELETGNHRGEIAVAGTLTIPIHRPLDLDGTGPDRGKGIGCPHATIIVGMNSDFSREALADSGRDRCDFIRHRATVGITENKDIRPTLRSCGKSRHGEFRIILVPVKEMLGIIKDLATPLLEIGHALTDHCAVFLMRNTQNLLDLKLPTLAENRYDRRGRLQQLGNLGIFGDFDACTSGASESRKLGFSKITGSRFRKEGHVLRIGSGPPSLDVIHPEGRQLLGNPDLVEQTEGNPLTLCSVAQSRVVNGYRTGIFHC